MNNTIINAPKTSFSDAATALEEKTTALQTRTTIDEIDHL
jgi:hypothetical protein